MADKDTPQFNCVVELLSKPKCDNTAKETDKISASFSLPRSVVLPSGNEPSQPSPIDDLVTDLDNANLGPPPSFTKWMSAPLSSGGKQVDVDLEEDTTAENELTLDSESAIDIDSELLRPKTDVHACILHKTEDEKIDPDFGKKCLPLMKALETEVLDNTEAVQQVDEIDLDFDKTSMSNFKKEVADETGPSFLFELFDKSQLQALEVAKESVEMDPNFVRKSLAYSEIDSKKEAFDKTGQLLTESVNLGSEIELDFDRKSALKKEIFDETEPTFSFQPGDSFNLSSSMDQPTTEKLGSENLELSVSIPQPIDATALKSSSNAVVSPKAQTDSVHQLKWITFKGSRRPVITQNANGPCPMIAIANFLILKGVFTLAETCEVISGERIIVQLSDLLLSSSPTNLDDGQQLNYETNVSDALAIFPSLQTGLDINIRFTGVSDFEYTTALSVFDLFKIPLFHGWVIDPQDSLLISVIEDRTYNQVVELVITKKSSENPDDVRISLLAEEFLEQSASQLTYYGLCKLSSTLREDQLGIFFRNNHFSTIYKKKDRIYALVTDAGFLNVSNAVWEELNDVDGDNLFVNADFQLNPPTAAAAISVDFKSNPLPSSSLSPTSPRLHFSDLSPAQQISSDFELAKQLYVVDTQVQQQQVSDYKFAKILQAEERAAVVRKQSLIDGYRPPPPTTAAAARAPPTRSHQPSRSPQSQPATASTVGHHSQPSSPRRGHEERRHRDNNDSGFCVTL